MKRRKAAAVSAFILMSVLLAGCSARTAAVDKDSADEPEKTKLQIAIFEGGYGEGILGCGVRSIREGKSGY